MQVTTATSSEVTAYLFRFRCRVFFPFPCLFWSFFSLAVKDLDLKMELILVLVTTTRQTRHSGLDVHTDPVSTVSSPRLFYTKQIDQIQPARTKLDPNCSNIIQKNTNP